MATARGDKMAVMKSWYVMLFFFVTQFLYRSYGDERQELVKSINILLNLQGFLNIGYPYDRLSLINMSLDDMHEIIDDLYDQMECRYLYSARSHLKLTGDVVFNNPKNIVTLRTIEDFSYEEEATMMIDSFRDPKPDRLQSLLSHLLYARQMRFYFWQVILELKLKDATVYKAKKLADNQLTTIENRIAYMRCATENGLNVLPEIEEERLFVDEELQKNIRCFSLQRKTAQSSCENIDDLMNTIRRNKQLLHKNFFKNRVNPLFQSPTQSLSYGSLWLFRHKRAAELFFDDFLSADSERFEIRFPGLDTENNLTGIAPLGQYQNRVIGTLKIIMWQITSSFVDQFRRQNFLVYAGKFKTEVLPKFQSLLVLEKDEDFKSLIKQFSKWYKGAIHVCEVPLNDLIDKTIKKITAKNGLPEIKSIVTDSEKSLVEIYNVGVNFVDRIHKEIGEIPIMMVQSFLNVINNT